MTDWLPQFPAPEDRCAPGGRHASEDRCTALARPVSRRTFLSLTAVAGTLTFLGQFTMGHRLVMAYADENGITHFTVYVLSHEEVPVVALDLTDPNNPKPVEGYRVQATAWVNMPKQGSAEKVATQVTATSETPTNVDGFTTLKIRKLTDEYDKERSTYSCFAQVKAEKDGYRMYETGQSLLLSGIPANEDGIYTNTLLIPAMPHEGRPYVSKLSFAGIDVQYSNLPCYIHAGNDLKLPFDVTIRNSQNKTWDVILFSDGKELMRVSTVKAADGVATAQLKETWLDGRHGIVKGSKLAIGWAPQGEKAGFKTSLDMGFEKSLIPTTEGFIKDLSVSPGCDVAPTQDFKKGKYSTPFPGKGSGSTDWLGRTGTVNLGLIGLPIEIVYQSDGSWTATATLGGMFFMKKRDGVDKLAEDPKNQWKTPFPPAVFKTTWSEFSRFKKHCADLFNPSTGAWDGWLGSTIARASPISTFDINVDVILQGMGKAEFLTTPGATEDDTLTKVDFAIGSAGKLAWEWTKPFTVMFVPCYVGVDFTASLTLKFIFGMAYETKKGVRQPITWGGTHWGGVPATEANMTLEPGFNLGVGAKNLISLGGRGYANLSFLMSTQRDKDKVARIVGSMHACFQVVAQFLFFRATFDIFKTPKWTFLNKSLSDKINGECDEVDYDWKMLRDDAFGEAYPSVDYSQEDFPEIVFAPSDMLAEADMAKSCKLHGTVRYIRDAQTDEWYWEEGDYEEGDWTAQLLESLYPAPEGPSEEGVIDPYGSGEGNYNPIRGIKPKRYDLQRFGAFSDDRSCFNQVWWEWESGSGPVCGWKGTWWRIDAVELEYASVTDSSNEKQPFVYADDSDPEAPTCYYMAPADGSCDKDPAPGWDSVFRSRLVFSMELTYCNFGLFDYVANVRAIPDRANTWDSEIDSCSLNQRYFVALSSFRREPGAEKSFDEIFKTQFITLVMKDHGKLKIHSDGFLHDSAMTRWSPRILIVQPGPKWRKKPGYTCSIYFYQRPKAGGTVTLGRGDYIESAAGQISTAISTVSVPTRIAGILDKGTLYVNSCACDDGVEHGDDRSADALQQRFIGWVKGKATADDTAFAVFWHEGHPESAVVAENVSAITMRPNAIGDPDLSFYYSRDMTDAGEKDIFMVNLNVSTRAVTGPTVVGKSTAIGLFAPNNGYLYSVRAMDGIAQTPDIFEEDDAVRISGTRGPFTSPQAAGEYGEAGKGGTVCQYQLLRAKWFPDYRCFSHFYSVALFDEPLDGVTFLSASYCHNGAENILGKTITSTQLCTANFHSIGVPHVVGIQLENIAPITYYCLPKDPCWVDLTVSNTGNEPLKSFKFKVVATIKGTNPGDPEKKYESSGTVDKLAAMMQLSIDDTVQEVDADGRPTGEWIQKPAKFLIPGTLQPGQTRTYRGSFPMPSGVQGYTTFNASAWVDINDAGYGSDRVNEAALSDDESGIDVPAEYLLTLDDLADAVVLLDERTKSFEVGCESVQAGLDLSGYSAGSTVEWSGDADDDGSGKRNAADTGDRGTAGILGTAGAAAVAAAVAGASWYEKRRTENEAGEGEAC